MGDKFSKGLRCASCGAPRANYAKRYCRDCYGPARSAAALDAAQIAPVISPWQELANGDRVRTVTAPTD